MAPVDTWDIMAPQDPGVLKVSQDPLGRPGRRVARRGHVDFYSR